MKIKRHKKLDRIDFASAHAVGIPGYNNDARQKAWVFARDTTNPRHFTFRYYLAIFAKDHRPKEMPIPLEELFTK